jgi:hypothetical protein
MKLPAVTDTPRQFKMPAWAIVAIAASPDKSGFPRASLKKPMSITDFLWSRFFEPNDRPEKNGSKPTIPSRTGVLLGN